MAKRPARAVEFMKVKAHVSRTSKLPEFLDRCRHYNHLADVAATCTVREADGISFNQTRVMYAKQSELRNVVGLYHSFPVRCAEHEFDKKGATPATSQFDIAILDVSSSCFAHVAIVDHDIAHQCPYGLLLMPW